MIKNSQGKLIYAKDASGQYRFIDVNSYNLFSKLFFSELFFNCIFAPVMFKFMSIFDSVYSDMGSSAV